MVQSSTEFEKNVNFSNNFYDHFTTNTKNLTTKNNIGRANQPLINPLTLTNKPPPSRKNNFHQRSNPNPISPSISSNLTHEMWLSRNNSVNTSPRRSNFSRHSFKNIDDLLVEDDKNTASTTTTTTADPPKPKHKPLSPVSSSANQPKAKQKPSSPVSSPPAAAGKQRPVFHSVRLANQFTRRVASPRAKPNREKPNKAHDSIHPAVKIHDKPNKAHGSIHPAVKIHEKPNKANYSHGHEKQKAHNSIAHEKHKAYDSIAPAIRIHEKPNTAYDSIHPAVNIHEKHNKTHDSIAYEQPKAYDSIAPAVRIHEKPNKAHDNIHPAVNIHEKHNKAHDSIVYEKSTAHDSIGQAVNIPNSENRVVVYMTSLGAVRPTFDACRAVRSILQGFRVPVDERDLSMDSSFRDELHQIMLQTQNTKQIGLPRVFIGGRYVGDADDVRQLSETGELKKLVEGLPAVSRGVCSGCGDFRFVICSECNGSRKCYRERGVFRSCMVCNKNGLIRCPSCWTVKS